MCIGRVRPVGDQVVEGAAVDDRLAATSPAQSRGGVLAMGDFGHERCGVGGSLASLAEHVDHVTVLDTAAPGLRRFLRACRAASRSGDAVAGVYPTRSTVYQRDLLARALLLRATFGRRRFRLHLHEYRKLRKKLRWPVTAVLLLPGRIIVSNADEQQAVRSALRGLVGRRTDVVVVPPTNGSAPSRDEVDRALQPGPERERTAGVFGMRRPDKGIDFLLDVLARLDPRFDRLVLAGDGWEEQEWPQALRDRFAIEVLGHVPRRALPELFASWGVAIAPLWEPAQDGRMSLRTPLAFGVPTISVGPRRDGLTLVPRNLLLVPPFDPTDVALTDDDRRIGADEVAAFEERTAAALARALFS
jgi:glycosyltransferase involved in cell wall biosynthesis